MGLFCGQKTVDQLVHFGYNSGIVSKKEFEMFNAKQTRLMNTLNIVSDKERYECYEAYCEVACEMAAEGMNAGTFSDYLERQVACAAFIAKRNAAKALA